MPPSVRLLFRETDPHRFLVRSAANQARDHDERSEQPAELRIHHHKSDFSARQAPGSSSARPVRGIVNSSDVSENVPASMRPGFPAFPDRFGVAIEIDIFHTFSD